MRRYSFTGESAVNTAKTHTLDTPSTTDWVDIKSLTITTRGGDIAADISIKIQDNGVDRWIAWLRSGKIYGAHFSDIDVIKLNSGVLQIVTAAGGADVVVVVSCVYKSLDDIEM